MRIKQQILVLSFLILSIDSVYFSNDRSITKLHNKKKNHWNTSKAFRNIGFKYNVAEDSW